MEGLWKSQRWWREKGTNVSKNCHSTSNMVWVCQSPKNPGFEIISTVSRSASLSKVGSQTTNVSYFIIGHCKYWIVPRLIEFSSSKESNEFLSFWWKSVIEVCLHPPWLTAACCKPRLIVQFIVEYFLSTDLEQVVKSLNKSLHILFLWCYGPCAQISPVCSLNLQDHNTIIDYAQKSFK